MQPVQPLFRLLKRLWFHLGRRRQVQFGFLLVLMILASFAEIVSIGAVLPFLAVLTAPDRVFRHPFARHLIEAFGITSPGQLLLPFTVTFCLAALLVGAMRLLMLWTSTRFSYAAGADLGFDIYRRTLYQPYAVHVGRNSSEIINTITNRTNIVTYAVLMSLTFIGASVMLIAILVALLLVDPLVALAAFGGFGLIYGCIIGLTRKKLLDNSARVDTESTRVIKSLQEGLGGIRDVVIDGSQAFYCRIYREADLRSRHAQSSNTFISGSPRFAMETLGMLLIATLAYVLARQPDGIARAIPVLGALALGAQRLLPVLQQAYNAITVIRGAQVGLQETLALLDQPLPAHAGQPADAPLPFAREIRLRHLSFRYAPETPWVLRNVDLTIDRGSRIGFIGTTGSGKSTLLDIIMGLLQPADGVLEVDGQAITESNQRAWQRHIAHVPQTIFLADSSIEENIAFGVPVHLIDHDRVVQAAHQAQIAEAIESWPEAWQTQVGERGVRLSGGQRQRIGIARALYKRADVIIFDEATSALDHQTEQAVMQAIESLSDDFTILIIAHRLTTLASCTQIVELADGSIRQAGSYQDIIRQQPLS